MLQDLQISSSDLQRMQTEGEDFKKFFELAKYQESVRSGKEATVRYEKRQGLLYRVYQRPERNDVSQFRSSCRSA